VIIGMDTFAEGPSPSFLYFGAENILDALGYER